MSLASMFEINNLIQGWRQIASMQCSPSHSSQAGLSEACEPVTNTLLCVTLTQPTSHSALHNHEKLGGGWEHWPDAWTCTRLVAALGFKAYFLWWGTDPSYSNRAHVNGNSYALLENLHFKQVQISYLAVISYLDELVLA